MKLFPVLLLVIPFAAATQETEIKQLRFLISDLRNNFTESISTPIAGQPWDSSHTIYTSKTSLAGSANDQIDLAKNKDQWATYVAQISDSCGLKDAKRLTEYWRQIIHAAAPNYAESTRENNPRTLHGARYFAYYFELLDSGRKYWIDISYSKASFKDGYAVIILLGRELQ